MLPNTCYNWHIDTERSVGINMLLSDVNSKCLFSENPNSVVSEFEELVYEPNTYYIFNTQKPHSVLNFEGDRYLFSVEFLGASKSIGFQNLVSIFS